MYGRLGQNASCELIVHLLSVKCLPVLLYSLEECSINASDVKTSEHHITTAIMQNIITKSSDVVHDAGWLLDSALCVYKRKIKFLTNNRYSANLICSAFEQLANCELIAQSDQLGRMQNWDILIK